MNSNCPAHSPFLGKLGADRNLAWSCALGLPLLICAVCLSLETPSKWWQSASGLLLLILMMTVTVTDLLWHKIPNWATYPAAIWGLVLNASATIAGTERMDRVLGAVGVGESLTGMVVLLCAMLIIYSFSATGAGDVKLAAVLGAYLGLGPAVDALLVTFIAAGGFALLRAIWQLGPLQIAEAAFRSIASGLLPEWILPPRPEHLAFLRKPMPLGPFFAIGVVCVLLDFRFMMQPV